MVRTKKAALEMSMSTIITIVLSVAFLILGLSILRNFYGFQSNSIDSIETRTLSELNRMYLNNEENAVPLRIDLGSEKTANIRSGTQNFGFAIYGNTISNARINNDTDIQFLLWLDQSAPANCVKLNGLGKVQSWFLVKVDGTTWLKSDNFFDSTAGVLVQMGIPAGTKVCSQKVYVKGVDRTSGIDETLGQDYFIINVLRQSPF